MANLQILTGRVTEKPRRVETTGKRPYVSLELTTYDSYRDASGKSRIKERQHEVRAYKRTHMDRILKDIREKDKLLIAGASETVRYNWKNGPAYITYIELQLFEKQNVRESGSRHKDLPVGAIQQAIRAEEGERTTYVELELES